MSRLVVNAFDEEHLDCKELQNCLADYQACDQSLFGYGDGIAAEHIVENKPCFGPEGIAE